MNFRRNMKLFYPALFQGEKFLKKGSKYFEGWYFKIITENLESIAFIPGISISKDEKYAFIQVIFGNTGKSEYIKYPLESFKYSKNKFEISIGNNYFSEFFMKFDITELNIKGEIFFTNNSYIKTALFSPGIMGPFSFVPFMECSHGLILMNSFTEGVLNINNNPVDFGGGKAYVEKDWGRSFPEKWIWLQGNKFSDKNSSFVFSIAKIPWLGSSFVGFFSVLIVDNKEYRFATYKNSKIDELIVSKKSIKIELRNFNIKLEISVNINNQGVLVAPSLGKMDRKIYESIDSVINIKLLDKSLLIYEDQSLACGCEIVNFF